MAAVQMSFFECATVGGVAESLRILAGVISRIGNNFFKQSIMVMVILQSRAHTCNIFAFEGFNQSLCRTPFDMQFYFAMRQILNQLTIVGYASTTLEPIVYCTVDIFHLTIRVRKDHSALAYFRTRRE